jgi:hypothetical protein
LKNAGFDWALVFLWMMATTVGWVLGRLLLPDLSFVVTGLAIGILQAFVLQHRLRNAWWWAVATTFGWMAGSAVGLLSLPLQFSLLPGFTLGALLGLSQWLVLRRQVYWSGWWIALSLVGWTTGLVYLPGLLLTGAIAGLLTGVTLALLLRFPKPLQVKPLQIDPAKME